jgi:hypothetical protein
MEDLPGRSAFEKHAQTLVLLGVAGICAWTASTLSSATVDLAVLGTKVDNLQLQVEELKSVGKGAISKEDADKTHDLINRRLDDITSQLRSLKSGNIR